MPYFTWPETLLPRPTPSLSGDVAAATARSNMESGRVRQRARFTTGWRTQSVTWVFSNYQFSLFQAIVKYKLNNGADFFEIQLPIGDEADEEEEDLSLQVVRIVNGAYKYAYQDVLHWKVTASLENENTSPMTEEELNTELGI